MLTPTATELRDVAVAAARAGGAVVTEGMHRPKQVELKSERSSIVTWVDVHAQREIVRVISERFPDHAILAEEGGPDSSTDGPCTWLVDPLDGTSNYAHGVPFSCTSVAVLDADGLAAGAIYEPFRNELFTAVRGGGAWLDDQRLSVSTTDVLSRALVGTGIQSEDPSAIAEFGRRMVALSTHCRAVRCVGSPALCLAYVAAGRMDAFVERGSTFAWDVGAGALMITEAGGFIEAPDRSPLNLGPGLADVLATNGRLHAELADVVRATS